MAKFTIERKNGAIKVVIPLGMNGDDVEIMALAVSSYNHLIKWNSPPTSGSEFAAAIRQVYGGDQSLEIAATLERY